MRAKKQKEMIQNLEHHLRRTTRQLVKMDTEEEAIQFLIDSFFEQLLCDFVGVILVEGAQFIPKAWEGKAEQVESLFPLQIEDCSPLLLRHSLRYLDSDQLGACKLTARLDEAGVKTWFTVPLIDDEHRYGFCIIGFYTPILLLDMYQTFDEFGKDVAVAIAMARRKNRKIKEMAEVEWIQYFSINKSLEESIDEFTLRATKITNARSAAIYLWNEKEEAFQLQASTNGQPHLLETISVHQNRLQAYFPYLEQIGGRQISIPIVINLKIIGVLHVEGKEAQLFFSKADHDALTLLADHIAILLENAQLYNKEKEQRRRLQSLLDYQQALVKETVIRDDFHSVTSMLSALYHRAVILFDRFLRPLTTSMEEGEAGIVEQIRAEAEVNRGSTKVFKVIVAGDAFTIWPITGVDSLLGYLAIQISEEELDEFDQLTIALAQNICSIQFIKQKLVLDANEQAKETLLDQILVQEIKDEARILQYANLFQWDIDQPQRVVNLAIQLAESERREPHLFGQRMKKSVVWDSILEQIYERHRGMLTAIYHEQFLLFVPVHRVGEAEGEWGDFYKEMQAAARKSGIQSELYLGIGRIVTQLKQFYQSYEESVQALNVVKTRFKSKGYAFFEELGSYTLLHRLDGPIVTMFMQRQLGRLHRYSKEHQVDLLHILRVYLQHNGNVKRTSERLFMHRSTLIYRLEKIESLLDVDLSDWEVRFDLMMALKFYDLKGQAALD